MEFSAAEEPSKYISQVSVSCHVDFDNFVRSPSLKQVKSGTRSQLMDSFCIDRLFAAFFQSLFAFTYGSGASACVSITIKQQLLKAMTEKRMLLDGNATQPLFYGKTNNF